PLMDTTTFAFLFLTALFAVGFGQVPGGLTDVDVNDKGAKIALSHAMDEYNRGSGDDYLYKVVEVIKVQGQAVEGYEYIITVRIARTLCRKDSVIGLCSITNPALIYQCTFVVWSRPWLNDWQLLEAKCH
uniref:Cystatin domain-containing protein n=1 Tax=Oryzias latipes TaxID=8090 RepID=A0A3P9MDL4_ORYLA